MRQSSLGWLETRSITSISLIYLGSALLVFVICISLHSLHSPYSPYSPHSPHSHLRLRHSIGNETLIASIDALVRTYIQRPQSIILCLDQATSDLANSKALSFVQKYADPELKRTIYVANKFDNRIPPRSSSSLPPFSPLLWCNA